MTEPSLRLTGHLQALSRCPSAPRREPGMRCRRGARGARRERLGQEHASQDRERRASSPDDGTVEILDQPADFGRHVAGPSRLGLATVYQDNSLVPELTVAQNLYLGTMGEALAYRSARMPGPRRSSRPTISRWSTAARVADLSPAQRQFLEVVKALVSKPEGTSARRADRVARRQRRRDPASHRPPDRRRGHDGRLRQPPVARDPRPWRSA